MEHQIRISKMMQLALDECKNLMERRNMLTGLEEVNFYKSERSMLLSALYYYNAGLKHEISQLMLAEVRTNTLEDLNNWEHGDAWTDNTGYLMRSARHVDGRFEVRWRDEDPDAYEILDNGPKVNSDHRLDKIPGWVARAFNSS